MLITLNWTEEHKYHGQVDTVQNSWAVHCCKPPNSLFFDDELQIEQPRCVLSEMIQETHCLNTTSFQYLSSELFNYYRGWKQSLIVEVPSSTTEHSGLRTATQNVINGAILARCLCIIKKKTQRFVSDDFVSRLSFGETYFSPKEEIRNWSTSVSAGSWGWVTAWSKFATTMVVFHLNSGGSPFSASFSLPIKVI